MVAALDATAVARVRAEVERLGEEEDGVAAIVVGLPRRLNGQPTEMTSTVQAFADRLGHACGLPVILQDERLSSHEAEALLAERIKDWRDRKRALDAASAAVILQDYLDSRPPAPVPEEYAHDAPAAARLVAVGVVAAAAAAAGHVGEPRNFRRRSRVSRATSSSSKIPMGASTAAIGRQLADAGVVRDEWIFRAAVWWSGRARALQAGEYRFEGAATPLEVVTRIAEGRVFGRPLTFPEGLTIAEMAEIFEMRGFGPARAFQTAARNTEAVSDLDPAARDLEGYLFPATYALPRTATAEELVAMMVERFRSVWAEVSGGRALGGMTVRQVMALASLVEKETAAPEERPLVSAVYRNRLERRMGLQADPTVVYALSKAGRYTGNIPQGRSGHQLALQHLPLPRPAARPDRGPGPGRDRGRPRTRGRAVSLFREPQQRHARVRRDPDRAQRERAEVSGRLLPQQARAARGGEAAIEAKAKG